jgi:hypothetical protein
MVKRLKVLLCLVVIFSVLGNPILCWGEDYTDAELLKSITVFVSENSRTDGSWTTVSIKDWKEKMRRTKISWVDEDIIRIFCDVFGKTITDMEILCVETHYTGRSGGGVEPSFILFHYRKKVPWNNPR